MQKIELLRKEECKFSRELPRQMRLSYFILESCEYIFLVRLQQKLRGVKSLLEYKMCMSWNTDLRTAHIHAWKKGIQEVGNTSALDVGITATPSPFAFVKSKARPWDSGIPKERWLIKIKGLTVPAQRSV